MIHRFGKPWLASLVVVVWPLATVIVCLTSGATATAQDAQPRGETPLLSEAFDQIQDGTAIDGVESWQAFRGFNGPPPAAIVREGLGRNRSHALTFAHSTEFRSDVWGVKRQLAQPLSQGVVWIECFVHPPAEWTGGVYFDARAGRETAARVAGIRHQPKDAPKPVLQFHASWSRPYWRLYRELPLQDAWYRLTMRLDLDSGTYAAWVDDTSLGEELPLCTSEPIDHVFIGLGGTAESPARLDDLRITRQAPAGRTMRPLLPKPEAGLQFRMAVIGDPQLGFGGYDADMARFAQAVEQVNRSGAELTLIMGDMVHDNDDEQSYRDLKTLAGKLKSPAYYVRGNHEQLSLYQKHFHPQADFAFTHQGWRFVFLDAIGNQVGLSDEQLQLVEKEFGEATQRGEEIVLCLHVSPWQDNDRGRGPYNQIGPGRDALIELLHKHQVLLCLSGHYHRGLWHHQEKQTHYMVFGGTAQVRFGWLGWCLFDVYADRIVVHEKPLHFGYVRAEDEAFYNANYSTWVTYKNAQKQHPYLQHGPLVIRRNAGTKAAP